MNHVIILCNDHDKGSFFRLKRKWVNGIYVTFRKGNFFCLFVYLAINNIRLTRRVSLRLVPVTPFIPIVQPFMRATLWRLVLGIFFTQLKTWDLLRGILTERLQLTIVNDDVVNTSNIFVWSTLIKFFKNTFSDS